MSAPVQPQPTTPPAGPVRPWQDPPQVPAQPGPMGPQPRYRQTSTAADLAALLDVRRLAMDYAGDQPPAILGQPTSEWGRGYLAGLRDLARSVLDILDGTADPWPCCGEAYPGPHAEGCNDNWVR